MAARLNHVEWWLLDLVEDASVPLAETVNGDYGVNKKFYPYSREVLFEAFCHLASEGWIRGGSIHEPPSPLSRDSIQLELRRPVVAGGPADRLALSYSLTESGGKVWESFANPDWHQYIEIGGDLQRVGDTIYATCVAREVLEHMLRLWPSEGIDVEADSIRWSDVGPWNVRYWKTLPAGYKLSFKVRAFREVPCWDWVYHHHTSYNEWRSCRP
jgi:hypothetical protein